MRSAERSEEKSESKRQLLQKAADQHGSNCRHCRAALEQGARFCGECGHSTGDPCPHCGAEVGGGDFCEACGNWMYDSQCRFCYAQLTDDAAFCSECGNDRKGLWCDRCQRESFFDFCGGCCEPLSLAARQMALQAPADSALSAAILALHLVSEKVLQATPSVSHAADPTGVTAPLQKAKSELDLEGASRIFDQISHRESNEEQAARQATEAAHRMVEAQRLAEQARLFAAQRVKERDAREQAEWTDELPRSTPETSMLSAQLREARERVKALLDASEKLTFADPQEARRHFMSVRQKLASTGFAPRKWLCNFANCQHDNPNECADPSQGGRWLFD